MSKKSGSWLVWQLLDAVFFTWAAVYLLLTIDNPISSRHIFWAFIGICSLVRMVGRDSERLDN